PLVTYADTQGPARSDPSKRVWQLMGQRINSTTRSMPPGRSLPSGDLDTLNRWIAAGAPAATGPTDVETTDAADDARPVGPDALPCDPSARQSFHTHGATSDAPF